MSNILSYNKKTTGEGWVALNNQYHADEIEMIDDPDGGLTQRPRTAIPSPFAQMDLVKNAFSRLSRNASLQGEAMDERLVANALDVAQLFFNMRELKDQLSIVVWRRDTDLDRLYADPVHRLLADTLEMFFEQDRDAFNFDLLQSLCMVFVGNRLIGSTSPVSLFMASPDASVGWTDLLIEENVRLFDLWRPLPARDPRFVKYIYALFAAYPVLKRRCVEVNAYLVRAFELLPERLRLEILTDIARPSAIDDEATRRALSYLERNYDRIDGGYDVIGVPLYCAKSSDIETSIAESDLMIAPSRKTEGRLPLVIRNQLLSVIDGPVTYISRPWSDQICVRPQDYSMPPEERILPATSHRYPWVTTDDFLESSIIKLDYALNTDCFFDGNLTIEGAGVDSNGFLLPLKPLFFQYFNVEDLRSDVNGHPMLEMTHSRQGQSERVHVRLRIPIAASGRCMTLERSYVYSGGDETCVHTDPNQGTIIPISFAVSLFPFIRTKGMNHYHVQLVDRALGKLERANLQLSFYKDGFQACEGITARQRSLKSEKKVGSSYYRLSGDFDMMTLSLQNSPNGSTYTGVIIPVWAEYVPGNDHYTFAIDFGTTNTHIESMTENGIPEVFSIAQPNRNRLLASLYSGEHILYDVIAKQEFLPHFIGLDYGFPQRTVLSESERLDPESMDSLIELADVNIPFIYEKESIGYRNRVIANLKWSIDAANAKRVKAYLRELALLMYVKVILENGDPANTRLVWFYPLSMKVGSIRKLGDLWAKTYQEVFGARPSSDRLISMPESVAPYYFYKTTNTFRGAASTVVNIDVGGGTSDVVVFENRSSQPSFLTSFRFAANVLFGDSFSELPQGDTNPMVCHYVRYFKQLFESNDDKYGELNGILDDIVSKRRSEEINAFLFSVEKNKAVEGNDVFSYNLRLNEDTVRKIIFLYFYAALNYFVAKILSRRGIEMPRSIMYSGTGSKILNIVGSEREYTLLARLIFERVYQKEYGENPFSVVTEQDQPKQITCRGALMQVRDDQGCEQVNQLNTLLDDVYHPIKIHDSLLEKAVLTYEDMDDPQVRTAILDEVGRFNELFISICEDLRVEDRFLVDHKAWQLFKGSVAQDLEHHLLKGWMFMNKNQDERDQSDEIEDAVFFYPIIGSIRDNLIEKLKED